MAKKRPKATDLVKGSRSRNKPFLDTLSSDDLVYFYEVVDAMRQTPTASPYVVARKLKAELNSVAALTTIVRSLKGAMQ